MMGILIAMFSGLLMSVQGVWNTQVTKTTGMWVANMWVQFTAFVFCFLIWVIMGRDSISTITKVEPRFMLAGGILGVGITWTVIKSIESLGPAKAVLFIVVTQIAVAYLIELLGLFQVEKQPLELRKIAGIVLAIAGTWLFHSSSMQG